MIDEVAQPWLDSRWVAGQSDPGYGADCLRFIDAVLLVVAGPPRCPAPQRMPQDTAWHNAKAVAEVVRIMCERYGCRELASTEKSQPGDAVATMNSASPYHVGIVADDGVRVWNAGAQGVALTSIEALSAACHGRLKRYRPARLEVACS